MRQITKISFLEKGDKGVSITYKNFGESGLKDVTVKNCVGLPQADFKNALDALRWHLLFLTEFKSQVDFSKFPTFPADDTICVCGVTITGADDKEGLMITGYKTLSTGKGFSFNSPNLKFNEEGYEFMEELQKHLEVLKAEAGLYMAGKYAIVQLELPMDDTKKDPLPQASGSAGHFIDDGE